LKTTELEGMARVMDLVFRKNGFNKSVISLHADLEIGAGQFRNVAMKAKARGALGF
jgi:hypothetical protein